MNLGEEEKSERCHTKMKSIWSVFDHLFSFLAMHTILSE